MNIKHLKKFICVFIIAIILLSFLLPNFDTMVYIAATIIQSTTETTKRKTVGHKVEGAEYYDEMWEKFRVIAVDNGGGNGEGGGAGGNGNFEGGNSGTSDEAGGVFGNAAGSGTGSGSQQNVGGTGGTNLGSGSGSGYENFVGQNGQNGQNGSSLKKSNSYGSSGSNVADALRALKQDINESRAESVAREIETAIDASIAAASIAEKESIQASIKKRMVQESIKMKLAPKETLPTQVTYETPEFVQEEIQTKKRVLETLKETLAPTSVRININIYDDRRETTIHNPDALETLKAQLSTLNIKKDIVVPTEQFVFKNIVEEEIMPTAKEEFNTEFNEIVIPEIVVPLPTLSVYENDIVPTAPSIEMTLATVETFETLETFETPKIIETIDMKKEGNDNKEGETDEVTKESETIQTVAEKPDNEESGEGAKGGQEAEADEDLEGDDGIDESVGIGDEKGMFQNDTDSNYVGKKIFELDTNGNIGLNPERLSVTNFKYLMVIVLVMLLLFGAIGFLFSTRDHKNKYNYF